MFVPGSVPAVSRRSISSRTSVLGATLLMAWASFRSTLRSSGSKLRPLSVSRKARTSPLVPGRPAFRQGAGYARGCGGACREEDEAAGTGGSGEVPDVPAVDEPRTESPALRILGNEAVSCFTQTGSLPRMGCGWLAQWGWSVRTSEGVFTGWGITPVDPSRAWTTTRPTPGRATSAAWSAGRPRRAGSAGSGDERSWSFPRRRDPPRGERSGDHPGPRRRAPVLRSASRGRGVRTGRRLRLRQGEEGGVRGAWPERSAAGRDRLPRAVQGARVTSPHQAPPLEAVYLGGL